MTENPSDPPFEDDTPAAPPTWGTADARVIADSLVALFPQGTASPSKGKKGHEAHGPLDWQHYTVAERVKFLGEIRASLPPTRLSELDLEQEVLLQYHSLTATQAEILSESDGKVAPNQLAALANTISSLLVRLSDRQKELYTTERLKRVEKALIDTVRELPTETLEKFLDAYKKALETL